MPPLYPLNLSLAAGIEPAAKDTHSPPPQAAGQPERFSRLGRIQVESAGYAGHAKERQSSRIDHSLRGKPFNGNPENQPGFWLCRRRFVEDIGLRTRHKRTAVRKKQGH